MPRSSAAVVSLCVVLGAFTACSSTQAPRAAPADGGGGDDASADGEASDAADDTAPNDAADGAAEAGACVSGLKQATPACTTCQDAHCCITASACAKSPSSWNCSGATVCRQDACATECGTPAPTCGNIIPSPASCTDALRKACCAEMTACGQSDQCLALVYICIDGQNCDPSQPCFTACRTKWPDGAKIFDAMNACSANVSCP